VKQAATIAVAEAKKINEKYDITGHAFRALNAGAKSVANLLDDKKSSSTISNHGAK
jgi:hypothetical protein